MLTLYNFWTRIKIVVVVVVVVVDARLTKSMTFFINRKIYIAEEQQKILELHHLGDVSFYFIRFCFL